MIKEARHDIETKDAATTLLNSEIFKMCGIVPGSSQLIQWHDHKQEDEGDAAEVPQLTELPQLSRQDELWHEDWLRIFTDGGVSDPDDCRLSLGGCGVYFGHSHPYNTATAVVGRQLDSYRAELQAVRLTLSGCRSWPEKIWVTLDNQAVVHDLNRCIQNQGRHSKVDNLDIWESVATNLRERAERGAIRISWSKGHATTEDIAAGKATETEMARNAAADELATRGMNKNNVDGVTIKAAKQRKRLAMLQQTMLTKIWLNRQELVALDAEEKNKPDEEEAAIAEMEAAFGEQPAAAAEVTATAAATAAAATTAFEFETQHEHANSQNSEVKARRTWHFVKEKVPTFLWENSVGGRTFPLKEDPMPKNLKEGGQSWYYALASGKRDRILIDFPLHLWGEVGSWWSRLTWADRQPGLLC